MAKIAYMIFCEALESRNRDNIIDVSGVVETNQQGTYPCLLAPLAVLRLPFLPTVFTLSFSAGIFDLNAKDVKKIEIEIKNPSGNVVFKTTLPMIGLEKEINRQCQIEDDEPNFIQFAGTLNNIIFVEEGIYTTQIYVNGDEVGSSELDVRKSRINSIK